MIKLAILINLFINNDNVLSILFKKSIFVIQARQLTREDGTGCCIRNDYSGCSQTARQDCSTLLSVFHKWTPEDPGPDGRISGQDVNETLITKVYLLSGIG